MSEITITVDEDELTRVVTEQIADAMRNKYSSESRDTKYGIRKGVESAVKAYIYASKDEIIDRCVARASAELVRKGLPKLIERMGNDE